MTSADQPDSEDRMLRIWGDVLQSSTVDLDDDLIETGGDSVTAMTLISRISAEFDVELELWDLLDAGTPRRVLEVVRRAQSGAVAEA